MNKFSDFIPSLLLLRIFFDGLSVLFLASFNSAKIILRSNDMHYGAECDHRKEESQKHGESDDEGKYFEENEVGEV